MASWRCVGHCGGPSPRPTSSRPRGLRATSAAALALAASLPPPGSFPPWSQPKPDAGSKESASKGAAAEGSDRPFTFPALPTLTIPGLPTVPPGTNAGDLIAPALAQALLHLLKSTGWVPGYRYGVCHAVWPDHLRAARPGTQLSIEKWVQAWTYTWWAKPRTRSRCTPCISYLTAPSCGSVGKLH